MTLCRSYVCTWLLAGSLLAAAPVLAQKKTNKPLTPAQQAERAKFDPKAEASPFGGAVVEESVAQVNDQIINTSDYNRAAAQLEQEGRQQGWSEQDLEDHKRDLLRDLIDQQLLLSRGKDLGITGETELVRRLDDIRKQNHLDTMEDLEKAASSQGVSYEDFKQNIRNSIITQQVIREEVGRRIQLTDAQLQQYYRQHINDFTQPESVRLSEILIPVKSGGDENANLAAAKAKADELDAKIKAGASFEDLAKANSAGSTAAQGGDLGEWKRGSLAKQLEDATFALQAGQTTEPIRTRQGYVILKVVHHTPGGTQPFASVRTQVEEAAFMAICSRGCANIWPSCGRTPTSMSARVTWIPRRCATPPSRSTARTRLRDRRRRCTSSAGGIPVNTVDATRAIRLPSPQRTRTQRARRVRQLPRPRPLPAVRRLLLPIRRP